MLIILQWTFAALFSIPMFKFEIVHKIYQESIKTFCMINFPTPWAWKVSYILYEIKNVFLHVIACSILCPGDRRLRGGWGVVFIRHSDLVINQNIFNFGYIFWMLCVRLWNVTWRFLVAKCPCVPKCLTLWPWRWSFTYFLKDITLKWQIRWYMACLNYGIA
jgi:hypothetical protein